MRSADMRRPLLWAALFTLGALIMCAYGLELKIIIPVLLAAAALCTVFVRKSLLPMLLVIVISSLIAVRFMYIENRAAELGQKYDGVETMISGQIYTAPVYSTNLSETVLNTSLGLISLTCYNEGAELGEIGDYVTVTALLRAPSRPRNDYGFDSLGYLYSRRIYLTATAYENVRFSHKGGKGLRYAAAKIREKALSTGERYLRGKPLELYSAIVFGDKSHLSPELKSDLSISGLSHIAAVSGMHLSVISIIIMFLLSLLLGKRRLTGLLTIPVMILFALITGGEPSVVRACVMNIIFQLSLLLYRDNDSLSSLSLAFIAMCGFNPMLIYSTGFQLSMAATLGIILFSKELLRPVHYIAGTELFTRNLPLILTGKLICGILSIIAVSVSAQLAALPIIVRSFHYIPTYALLSNILVVPFLTFIMAAGLLLAMTGAVMFLAKPVAAICGLLLSYVAFVAEKIAGLPVAAIPVGGTTVLVIIAYTALILALFALLKKKRLAGLALSIIFASASILGGIQLCSRADISELCFLNVGRGDCALFNLKGGTRVLIDGGRGSSVEEYLEARGFFSIDCAVVTSNQLEQLSGLIELVDGNFIRTLYVPEEVKMTDRLETLLLAADETGTPVVKYGTGGSIYAGGLRLTAIDCGENSVQLLAEYEGKRILMCGDDVMSWTDCDIVRIPAHGSGKYSYANELERSSPGYAVITASSSRALSRSYSLAEVQRLGIDYFIPADCGTVTFDLRCDEITVTTTAEKYKKAR